MKNDKNTTTPLDVGVAVAAAVEAVDLLPDGVREQYRAVRCALSDALVKATNHPALADGADDADGVDDGAGADARGADSAGGSVADARTRALDGRGTTLVCVPVDAAIRESWIREVALELGVFDIIRYWGHGVSVFGGWIVFEGERAPTDAGVRHAARAYAMSEPLPDGWHLLDRVTAERAFAFGVARRGASFGSTYSGNDVDVVMQLALLGEVRYG